MCLMRIDKFLANSGVGSRSEVRKFLRRRRIFVNEELVLKPEIKINPNLDKVFFDNNLVEYHSGYLYIIMNKPSSVICSTSDNKNKTVLDLIDNRYKSYNLFPVGRLDKDTVGLLILTNNGKFAHNALSPKKHIKKTYLTHINGKITKEDVENLESGITIDNNYTCLPAYVEILDMKDTLTKLNITIKEGKYHQIKRMFKAIGKEVLYLKRIKFAGIELDETIKEGEYRLANSKELDIINRII